MDKLSIFCITVFLSYTFIALLKQSENILFLYLNDATIIILKIINIIFINFFINNLKLGNLMNNHIIIKKIIEYFPIMEDILFEQLILYPKKVDKIKNIDKIIIAFISNSILLLQRDEK